MVDAPSASALKAGVKSLDTFVQIFGAFFGLELKTKESTTVDKQAEEAMAKIYQANGGDPTKLAKATGANEKKLKSSPPKDAKDFAKKILAGEYE